MPDQNDLNKPDLGSSYTNEVLETLRGHIVRLWTGTWGSMAGVVNGMLRWEIPGGNVLRLWRRNGSGTDDLVFDSTSLLADGSVTTAKLANGVLSADAAGRAKMADGFTTTAKLADGSVTTAKWAAANGQLSGFRNKIINGKMNFFERGSSKNNLGNSGSAGVYTADRFCTVNLTNAIYSVSLGGGLASNNTPFPRSLQTIVNTADTSITADEYFTIEQRMEGAEIVDLLDMTFTLSFWVRSSKTGVYCVSFGGMLSSSAPYFNYVTEYSINQANTWEFKTITVNGGLPSQPIPALGSNTWSGGANDIQGRFKVAWVLAAGSNRRTASVNSWVGLPIATNNQINFLDTANNAFWITGVQLEVGATATPFEHRPASIESVLCERYYERAISFTPIIFSGDVTSGSQYIIRVPFRTLKRTNESGSNVNIIIGSISGAGFPSVAESSAGGFQLNGFNVFMTANATVNGGNFVVTGYQCSSEL